MNHPLQPPLPFAMNEAVRKNRADAERMQFVANTTELKYNARLDSCQQAFGGRYEELRSRAGELKQHTLDYLDHYLKQFVDNARLAGSRIHFAIDAEQANQIVLDIATEQAVKLCMKSKSMLTEETQLLDALQDAGIQTVETDLGEFILQLDGDAPSHIVTPMIHKNRSSVGRAFERELQVPYTDDPEQLTIIARDHMRDLYAKAQLGVTGANFLIAETGDVVICTNEGNADLALSLPNTHIVMVGIEKVIPRREDLTPFLKLLARSATGQPLTVYTTLVNGPARKEDADGPQQVHIVLVDNGRTALLPKQHRELLRCIRCGACLNACPVFRSAGGGHAYGSVYSGPIGAALTPHFKGLHNYADLPKASSLCGACKQACPVNIDIPRHLIAHRRELAKAGKLPLDQKLFHKVWCWSMRKPWRYRWALKLLRIAALCLAKKSKRSPDRFDQRSWIRRAPGLSQILEERELPTPTEQSFRDWWQQRD